MGGIDEFRCIFICAAQHGTFSGLAIHLVDEAARIFNRIGYVCVQFPMLGDTWEEQWQKTIDEFHRHVEKWDTVTII